ncbi:MAG: folate family ECF transporter S component [Anaerovoracaceae bacterium]
MIEKITTIFRNSAEELKNVKTFTVCAMLGAISMVLGYFSVQVTESVKIDFANVPIEMGAALFGPVVGPLMGAAMDIINYFAKPTGPFFAGFTISAIVMTLIIGIAMYKKPLTLKRVVIATFICVLVVDLGMNTLWLSILYHKAVYIMLPVRMLKCLIFWPIQAGMMYVLLKALRSARLAFTVKEQN